MKYLVSSICKWKHRVMYLCRDLQEKNQAQLEHFLLGVEEEPRLQLEKTWCNPADARSTGTVVGQLLLGKFSCTDSVQRCFMVSRAFFCYQARGLNFNLPLVKSPNPISSGLVFAVSLTSLISARHKMRFHQCKHFTTFSATLLKYQTLSPFTVFTDHLCQLVLQRKYIQCSQTALWTIN